MPEDRVFRFALLISTIIHTAAFLNPQVLKLPQLKSQEKKIEINYVQMKALQYSKSQQNFKEVVFKENPVDKIIKTLPPPFIKKDEVFKQNLKNTLPKPNLSKPDIISVKKIIQLTPIEITKIKNPVYMHYYQTIREKIKRCAYQNYNRSDTGQVYLTFVVLANGVLADVHIIEEKTKANSYLKEIALRSIRDASPFPTFPKELDYEQLTFNVIISFEIE